MLELSRVCPKPECRKAGIQEFRYYQSGPFSCKSCGDAFDEDVDSWKKRVTDGIDWAEVVVFQRGTHIDHIRLMMEAKSKGKLTVFEADDNHFSSDIPKWNTGYEYYSKIQPFVMDLIRTADMVTVTTEPLRQKYLELNKNISVLARVKKRSFWSKDRDFN